MKISKSLIKKAAIGGREEKREAIKKIKKIVSGKIKFQTIFPLYEKIAEGELNGFIVPAFNIRMLTYEMAAAIFRAAKKEKAGAFIIELARSEINYTKQSPEEFSAIVSAAAYNEGYFLPLFLQGDHYRINREAYFSNKAEREKEIESLKRLIKKSIKAGFYNIDIDGSGLVKYNSKNLEEKYGDNARETAKLTKFIRDIQPAGTNVSVGGEIGEIGGENTTEAELKTFLKLYFKELKKIGESRGIIKIAVQTGTSHGGVVLPSGKLKKINEDYKSLSVLSKIAKENGLAGAVQHGASTLSDNYFPKFKRTGACEIHLATGLQNMVLDSKNFPGKLKDKMDKILLVWYNKNKIGTKEQYIYKNRKYLLGTLKKELWAINQKTIGSISEELEERFVFFFKNFGISNSARTVKKTYQIK